MFCKNCGAQLRDGAAFCTQCGTKLDSPVPAAGAASTPDASAVSHKPAFSFAEARSSSSLLKFAGVLAAVAGAFILVVLSLMFLVEFAQSYVQLIHSFGTRSAAVTAISTLLLLLWVWIPVFCVAGLFAMLVKGLLRKNLNSRKLALAIAASAVFLFFSLALFVCSLVYGSSSGAGELGFALHTIAAAFDEGIFVRVVLPVCAVVLFGLALKLQPGNAAGHKSGNASSKSLDNSTG